MAEALETTVRGLGQTAICDQCGRNSLKGWSFAFKKPVPKATPDEGVITKCPRCALRHLPMLRRSLMVALVVGTILTLLNQGDIIFSGSSNTSMFWKVPLTYCVPFCVTSYGALTNSRR